MSINSSLAADWFNEIKGEWVRKLKAAHDARDWLEVAVLLEEMQRFTAGE